MFAEIAHLLLAESYISNLEILKLKPARNSMTYFVFHPFVVNKGSFNFAPKC